MLASFTSVIVNRSPTLPCNVGPGAVPLKVHSIWRTPGATSTRVSRTVKVTRCSVAPGAGCSVGSYACQPAAGTAWKSMTGDACPGVPAPAADAPGVGFISGIAAAADGAALVAPDVGTMLIVIPAA